MPEPFTPQPFPCTASPYHHVSQPRHRRPSLSPPLCLVDVADTSLVTSVMPLLRHRSVPDRVDALEPQAEFETYTKRFRWACPVVTSLASFMTSWSMTAQIIQLRGCTHKVTAGLGVLPAPVVDQAQPQSSRAGAKKPTETLIEQLTTDACARLARLESQTSVTNEPVALRVQSLASKGWCGWAVLAKYSAPWNRCVPLPPRVPLSITTRTAVFLSCPECH